ncbi:hypothetical protein ACFL5O_05135 [Myxococcota bacterium]
MTIRYRPGKSAIDAVPVAREKPGPGRSAQSMSRTGRWVTDKRPGITRAVYSAQSMSRTGRWVTPRDVQWVWALGRALVTYASKDFCAVGRRGYQLLCQPDGMLLG